MKGVVLSGGEGRRLRPFTHSGAKQMIPVANRPVLWYGIDSLVAAGITDIAVIISPITGPQVKYETGDGSQFGALLTYIEQTSPLGLAQAVSLARPFLGDSHFLLYLGDVLLTHPLTHFLDRFRERGLDALLPLKALADPRPFGVARVEGERVVEVVEKPPQPPSNLVLVGVYLFSPAIHQAIQAIQPSARGELEITDAIQELMRRGGKVEWVEVGGWWADVGTKDAVLEANRTLLLSQSQLRQSAQPNHSTSQTSPQSDSSTISGWLSLGTDSSLRNCTITGPVMIGVKGPMKDSIIGRRATLSSTPGDFMQLSICDDSNIELPS